MEVTENEKNILNFSELDYEDIFGEIMNESIDPQVSNEVNGPGGTIINVLC